MIEDNFYLKHTMAPYTVMARRAVLNKGFTLIELLVAVTIMAIVATLSVGFMIAHYQSRPTPVSTRINHLLKNMQSTATSSGSLYAIQLINSHLQILRYSTTLHQWQRAQASVLTSSGTMRGWQLNSNYKINGDPTVIIMPAQIITPFDLHNAEHDLSYDPLRNTMVLTNADH